MRFRDVWNEYQEKEGIVKFEIVNMVKILEKEGLNRTEAIQKIINDHSDLKGFSRRTIYRDLPGDMKKTDPRKELRELGQQAEQEEGNEDVYKDSDVPNDTTEQLNKTDSAESETLKKFREQHGTLEEEEEPEPDTIIDPKLLDEKIQEIAKKDERIQELESTLQDVKKEKVESAMAKSRVTEYSIELSDQDLKDIAKNGGIEPLLLTLHADGKTQTAKLDRTRLHQKKR
jgi:hypothetical protein